jgi:transketolase
VIADTVKGRGVSFMQPGPEDQLYAYHSGAPDADTYQKAVAELIATANAQFRQLGALELRVLTRPWPVVSPPPRAQRLVPAYGRALVRQAEHDPRIVALDADLVRDCGLLPFRERFPDRFFECGIAEQDMVSQAGGMALKGLLPVVHSFAAFLSSRPNEQIYNNATERTKIVYVGSLAGILPGGPGHSHQAVRDVSTLGAVPGLIVLEPCNETEVELAVEFCFAGTGESCYLRLVSSPRELPYELPPGYRLQLGRGTTLREGRDAVVFGYGPVLLAEACKAADLLRKRKSIHVRVVNLPWLNRIDADWLRTITDGIRYVVTLDNHYVVGGQGDMLFRTFVEEGVLAGAVRVRRLGLTDLPTCGTDEEVLRACRLDAEGLYHELLTGLREHWGTRG